MSRAGRQAAARTSSSICASACRRAVAALAAPSKCSRTESSAASATAPAVGARFSLQNCVGQGLASLAFQVGLLQSVMTLGQFEILLTAVSGKLRLISGCTT